MELCHSPGSTWLFRLCFALRDFILQAAWLHYEDKEGLCPDWHKNILASPIQHGQINDLFLGIKRMTHYIFIRVNWKSRGLLRSYQGNQAQELGEHTSLIKEYDSHIWILWKYKGMTPPGYLLTIWYGHPRTIRQRNPDFPRDFSLAWTQCWWGLLKLTSAHPFSHLDVQSSQPVQSTWTFHPNNCWELVLPFTWPWSFIITLTLQPNLQPVANILSRFSQLGLISYLTPTENIFLFL